MLFLGIILLLVFLTLVYITFRPPEYFKFLFGRKNFQYYAPYVCGMIIIQLITIFLAVNIFKPIEYLLILVTITAIFCQFIFALVKGLIYCIEFYKEDSTTKLILYLILILISPDIIFGLLYGLFASLYNDIQFNHFDGIYFSFAIHYSLPLTDKPFITFIELINNNALLKSFQIIHIIFDKVVELILIGLFSTNIINKIVNKFNEPNDD